MGKLFGQYTLFPYQMEAYSESPAGWRLLKSHCCLPFQRAGSRIHWGVWYVSFFCPCSSSSLVSSSSSPTTRTSILPAEQTSSSRRCPATHQEQVENLHGSTAKFFSHHAMTLVWENHKPAHPWCLEWSAMWELNLTCLIQRWVDRLVLLLTSGERVLQRHVLCCLVYICLLDTISLNVTNNFYQQMRSDRATVHSRGHTSLVLNTTCCLI